MKDDVNPMNGSDEALDDPLRAANAAPRCQAHSKRTGEPCQAPAVTGWRVCRVHGAGGGHKAGSTHPRWRHGLRSQAWVEERRHLNELIRETRTIEGLIE